jgi:hypothetical protein
MLDIEMTPSEFGETLKNFKPDDWSVKIEYRKRDRMKVGFKLTKQEAEAFTNFKNQTKPDAISEDSFLKSIFFLGLSTLEANISRKIQEELAAQDENVEIPEEEQEVSDNANAE